MSYLPKVLSYRSTAVIKIVRLNNIHGTDRWFSSSTLNFNTKSATTTQSNVVATKRDSEIEGHHHRKQQQVHESPNAYRNLVSRAHNILHSPSYRNYSPYSTDATLTTPQITTKSNKRKMVSAHYSNGEWEKFISMVYIYYRFSSCAQCLRSV